MNIFKSKYLIRIEKKIIDLEVQKAYLKSEEVKNASHLNTTDRVHYIVLRSECDKKISLLRELL